MKRHALDPFSLVFGITFAALGSVFLASHLDASQLHLQWLLPIPLIALGVLIVALAGRRTSRERRDLPQDQDAA
jgi:cytochrome c-type biogenesis protein CcmH/NrfF